MLEFLLNTATFLRLDMQKQCKNKSDLLEKWNGTNLVEVVGTLLMINSNCMLNFCFENTTFLHSVLVVESLLCEGVLGTDFHRGNSCSINLTRGGGTLSMGSHKTEVTLSTVDTAKGECARVCVAHAICISAKSLLQFGICA